MERRFIPTNFHAFEDYTTAPIVPVLPRLFGWGPAVRRLFDGTAVAVAAQSALTDYEGGIVRALPMRAHLTADVLGGAGLIAAACLLDDEPPLARWALAGVGAYAVLLSSFTRLTPSDVRPAGRTPARRRPAPRRLAVAPTGDRR